MNDTQKNEFIDIENARVQEQVRVMQEIMAAGHCPFCWENFVKYNQEPPIKENASWRLVYNKWPYENTKVHLLAILKEHKERLHQLTREEGADLIELLGWAEQEFEIPGGGMAMRFGDTDYSAGTVAHLHAQFIMPDIHKPDYHLKPVKVKIGKYDKAQGKK